MALADIFIDERSVFSNIRIDAGSISASTSRTPRDNTSKRPFAVNPGCQRAATVSLATVLASLKVTSTHLAWHASEPGGFLACGLANEGHNELLQSIRAASSLAQGTPARHDEAVTLSVRLAAASHTDGLHSIVEAERLAQL